MIKKDELLEAINKYEAADNPTAQTCITLAAFYTVLDRLYPPIEEQYSRDYKYHSTTEFGTLIQEYGLDTVMAVMDELMTTLCVLNPPLYANVIDKIKGV